MRRAPATKTAHPVFDRLRAATGLTSDDAIASVIGLDRRHLCECRCNGKVPYRAIVTAVRAGVIRCDLHWVLTGERF